MKRGRAKKGIVYISKRILPPSKHHDKPTTRYYVISEVDGQKRYHGGYSLHNAQEKKRQLLAQITQGTFGIEEIESPLFGDYYEKWLSRKRSELRPTTIRSYENSYEKYIGPYFDQMQLSEVTPEIVQKFVDSINTNGLTARYIRGIYGNFRSCMNTAADLEVIEKSPCTGRIMLPPVPRKKITYFGPSDVWKLANASQHPYKALFAVLAFTGMRVGECLGLRCKNVDFESGLIRVEHTWDSRGAGELREPKTKSSIRSVEMISVLGHLLRGYADELGDVNPEAFLFPAPKDPSRPRSYNTVVSAYKSIIKDLCLEYHNIHSLRHSFASIAISAGLNIITLSRNLGHSSPDVTLRVYAHEIEETVPQAMEKLDTLFRDSREGSGRDDDGNSDCAFANSPRI